MKRAIRVLLVEDDIHDAELLLIALRHAGLDPAWVRVETAEELAAALASNDWDAIISDYNLPQFGAQAALAIVQQSCADLPFLVVSGMVGDESAVAMMRAGAHDYVLKDNLTRLAPALEREIRDWNHRRARRQADAALRVSEARYRRLFEAAQQGIVIVDATSCQIVDANPFLIKLLDQQPAEILGQELWQIGLFPDANANHAMFQRLKERGHIGYDDYSVITRNGRAIEVEFLTNIYEPADTRVIQCNIRDVTEQKRAALELETLSRSTARRERMLTSMLSSISDFTYLLNRHGRFLFVNQPLLDLWGVSPDEALGKDFHDLGYPRELAERLRQQVLEVFNTKSSITDENSITSRAGMQADYEYIFSPVLAANGTVEFVVGVTRDITERKRIQAAIQRLA